MYTVTTEHVNLVVAFLDEPLALEALLSDWVTLAVGWILFLLDRVAHRIDLFLCEASSCWPELSLEGIWLL